MEKVKSKNVFFVGLLSFFGGISQDVFAPILPIYLTTILGFDKTFIGVVEGIVSASANIFKVIAGLFSDKFKRRKPIIFVGYFLSMVARPLLAFFTSGAAIIGLRLTDGVGKGIKDPPKDVLIAGSSAKETRGRSFGIARMLDTLGSVAGPLILFALLYFLANTSLLYHYILLFSAVPLLITLVVLVVFVREIDDDDAGKAAVSKNDADLVSRPAASTPTTSRPALPKSFYLFLGIVILFTLGNSSDAFLILRARNVGVTLLEIPLVLALFNFIYALAAVPFGALSDKIGRIPTMLIGWFSFAAVYLGFAVTTQSLFIWLLYGLYGIYYATSEGVARAFLADTVGRDHRGRAFGIYGTTVGLATLPASLFAGFLWDKFGRSTRFISAPAWRP